MGEVISTMEEKIIRKDDGSILDFPENEKYNKIRQEHQAEMERKQEEADRLRRSELMKKNAEQNRKLEQEKREREKQSKLKGLEQDKKIEMDALANSGQATKKYIYEVMHEKTCPIEVNPSGIEWPIGATRIVAGSLYNFKNCHIESVCLNRKGINDSEF